MRPTRFNPFTQSSFRLDCAPKRHGRRLLHGVLVTCGLLLFLLAGARTVAAAPLVPLPIADTLELNGSFSSIWASAPDDIWLASAYSGNLLHFDGSKWTVVTTNFNGSLSALWGTGPTDLYAVGVDHGSHEAALLHFNGAIWEKTTFGVGLVFEGVWGSGPDDVYIVGQECGLCAPSAADIANPVGKVLILHFDGNTWSQIESGIMGGLQSIHGRGPSDIYAVGHTVTSTGTLHGLVMHFDGRNWRRFDRVDDSPIYKTVWTTATSVYAAGDGAIVKFDKTSWTTTPVDGYINAIWSDGDELLAVGSAVYHSDGRSWLPLSTSLPEDILRGVWAFDDTGIYTVGSQGVFQVLGATVEHHYSHLPLVARSME